MLVLTARLDDTIYIDDGRITATIIRIRGNQVRIAFTADKEIAIDRKDVHFAKVLKRSQETAQKQA
jgi:carbon storage regulator CsrA